MVMKIQKPFFAVIFLYVLNIAGLLITRGGIDDLFRLFYILSLLIILGWLWAFLSVRGFSVHRHVREDHKQLGEVLDQRFEVTNKFKIARPWLEVLDYSRLIGFAGSKVLAWVEPGERRIFSIYSVLKARGQYKLGPTVIQSGDPLGLFKSQRVIPHQQTLMVLPYLVQLRHFPYQQGILPGGRSKRVRTAEVTPHGSSVREYVPGDPLNRIHWPLTAKKNTFMVKEFDQEPMSDIWILLDGEQRYHYANIEKQNPAEVVDQFWIWKHREEYFLPRSTFEYGVSAAASIVNYYLQNGQTVGFGCVAQQPVILPAEKGERQLGKILETLAFVLPLGQTPLHALVLAQAGNLPRGCSVVLISSSTNSSLVLAADTLIRRELKPIVIFINPAGFGAQETHYRDNVDTLLKWKIPFCEINYGDSLLAVLDTGQMNLKFQSPVSG